MSLGIICSDIFKQHETHSHPENPRRLEAIYNYLDNKEVWQRAEKISPQKIGRENLFKIHSPEYLASFLDFCKKGGGRFDEDTVTSTGTPEAAFFAAGSVLQAVDLILNDNFQKIFCMIRPPGHHALPKSCMGFCFFNNLALGASYALEKYKLSRILILDWDAHHGNGTERIFYHKKEVMTISYHQANWWPYTGRIEDTGLNDGFGYNLNIPLKAGSTDETIFETFKEIIVPVIKNYQPELIMIAAGYDAHWREKYAGLNMTGAVFQYLSKHMVELAESVCNGKILMTLEGGYNLEALAEGVFFTLDYLQFPERKLSMEPVSEKNNKSIAALIEKIQKCHPFLAKI